MLKINILFSNRRFNARFFPQMYIYIGFNMIVYFWHVCGANKRIFVAYKIATFADGNGGGAPPATTDQRPTVISQDFPVRNLFSTLLDFRFSKVIQYLLKKFFLIFKVIQ